MCGYTWAREATGPARGHVLQRVAAHGLWRQRGPTHGHGRQLGPKHGGGPHLGRRRLTQKASRTVFCSLSHASLAVRSLAIHLLCESNDRDPERVPQDGIIVKLFEFPWYRFVEAEIGVHHVEIFLTHRSSTFPPQASPKTFMV